MKRKPEHAFCISCGVQLTWFTFHNIWEEGKIIGRVCGDCYLKRQLERTRNV